MALAAADCMTSYSRALRQTCILPREERLWHPGARLVLVTMRGYLYQGLRSVLLKPWQSWKRKGVESVVKRAWSPRKDQKYCECVFCEVHVCDVWLCSKQMLQQQNSIGARMLNKHLQKEEVAKREGNWPYLPHMTLQMLYDTHIHTPHM